MEIQAILESLCTVDGVTGAILVNESGEVTDSSITGQWDPDHVANLAYTGLVTGNRIADYLDRNPLKQSYIEFDDSSITLDQLKDGSILVLLASNGANLGRIRLEIRKSKKSIEGLIG